MSWRHVIHWNTSTFTGVCLSKVLIGECTILRRTRRSAVFQIVLTRGRNRQYGSLHEISCDGTNFGM
jgi:hypothetical protein